MNVMQMMSSISPVPSAAARTVASALTNNHGTNRAKPMDAAAPQDGSNSDGDSSDASTITSNDFLTLLVSELKNQDPTQPTDPNQYISQLVDVNSLQQLMSINQGITTLDTSVTGAPPATS